MMLLGGKLEQSWPALFVTYIKPKQDVAEAFGCGGGQVVGAAGVMLFEETLPF